MDDLQQLLAHAEQLLKRVEDLLPSPATVADWNSAPAFRWRKHRGRGELQSVKQVHQIALRDLRGIDTQKQIVEANTRQFVEGYAANNVLLTGARGTGKSSLVKALLNEYSARGLRLIEIEKHDLVDLPEIVAQLFGLPQRFILFCDDLSFEADEVQFKAIKVVLDGTVGAAPENCLIYATSNRRHLMPESMSDNLEAQRVNDEIHPSERVEERISLSERFGIWVSFYPFDQDQYLEIVAHWMDHFEVGAAARSGFREAALRWALQRGSRSGRVAWQFARDWAGRNRIEPQR